MENTNILVDKKNYSKVKTKSKFREYTEAIIIAFILAMFVRTFIVQAYKIPSGSMENTLLIGDHILVNKFEYGIRVPNRLPFLNTQVLPEATFFQKVPDRGDIVVFEFPKDPSRDFIKRVVALPGEKLEVKNRVVFIDNKKMIEPFAYHRSSLLPIMHNIPRDNFGPVIIPKGHIFVMGDNRENSQDSRYWGFLNINKIKGRAFMIYWSWDNSAFRVRWDRLSKMLK